MAGATNIIEGVLAYFPTQIIPKISEEPTGEALIETNRIISANAAYVASNFGGGFQSHLELTISAEEYLYYSGHVFIPQNNLGNY